MAIQIADVFRIGGVGLIEFLHYCVFSGQLEAVFAFLVQEYRNHATSRRALALYDLFCAPGALARIKAEPVLPPLDWRIHRWTQPFRPKLARRGPEPGGTNEIPQPLGFPAPYIFNFIILYLEDTGDCPLHAISRQFDPARAPLENLPNGKMTPGQRAFLENVWRPTVRPQLVAAGFWRIANIGG